MPTLLEMGSEVGVSALELRPWGLFTQVVPEVSLNTQGADRDAFGAKYVTRDVYEVVLDTFTCDADDDITSKIDLTTDRETLAFLQHMTMVCSTIGITSEEMLGWLGDDARLTESAALVKALTTQITTDHLNLTDDATALAGANSVAKALALIEDALATRIANGRGYILVPPLLLPHAMNDGIFLNGGQLVSPAGHRVISDAGMAGQTTMYGTGALAWHMTPPDPQGAFEFSNNTYTGAYTRYGIVWFNPAHAVKTAVTIS